MRLSSILKLTISWYIFSCQYIMSIMKRARQQYAMLFINSSVLVTGRSRALSYYGCDQLHLILQMVSGRVGIGKQPQTTKRGTTPGRWCALFSYPCNSYKYNILTSADGRLTCSLRPKSVAPLLGGGVHSPLTHVIYINTLTSADGSPTCKRHAASDRRAAHRC